MIDAMRSLINTSIEQFKAPQNQLEALQRNRKEPPAVEKTYTPNHAVEVTLSPQAQAILKALEANQVTAEQLQATGQQQEESQRQQEPTAIALPDDSAAANQNQVQPEEVLDQIIQQFGLPELSEEDAETARLLFREIQISLNSQSQDDTSETLASNVGLTPEEQMKVAALYAELDRLLGGTGVFFGGDQAVQRLSAENQIRARELRENLGAILGRAGQGGNPTLGLTAPQEARIDAILQEIAQLYARAQDGQAEPRSEAVRKGLGGDGAIASAGGASLQA